MCQPNAPKEREATVQTQRLRWPAGAVTLLLATGLAVSGHSDAQAAATDATELPAVLPALQEWQSAGGTGFAWTGNGRVVVRTADSAALSADARTFAADLGLDLNQPAPPVVTADTAAPGDILLTLGSMDPQLGAEGYAMTVAPVLSIDARAAAGAWWGTRTLLQLLRQSTTLPAGTARDWPKYPVRSTRVDSGGRGFPMGFWFNEIRDLSYLKVNELNVAANGLAMTDDQEKQLYAYAASYHVDLIGEWNMPAHMEPMPDEYRLRDAAGNPVVGALNIPDPAAVTWAKGRLTSVIDNFGGPVWHLGGDEWPTCCHRVDDPASYPSLVAYAHQQWGDTGTIEDVYRDFVNQIDGLVHQHGKSLRMWGDDLFPSTAVGLNSDITVEEWLIPSGDSMTPAELAANGNQLINVDQDFLYYDEGDPRFPNTTPQRLWEQFDPGRFNGGARLPGGDSDPHLSGLMLVQWDTLQEHPGILERNLGPLNRAYAQRAWGSPKRYPTWDQMRDTVAAIGRPPGFLDTPAPGDPGAGSLPGSSTEVFGESQNQFSVRSDGSLWHAWWEPGSSVRTERLAPAGSVAGSPTAFAYPGFGGQQHVYARGTDGHLHHWWTGSTSGGWLTDDWTAKAAGNGFPSLTLAGDPAGFRYGNEQHVYARGADGHLHHWWYRESTDQVNADDWGGQLTNTPLAYAWGSTQNVFARGPDGSLHHWWWQPSDPAVVHQDDWGGQLAADASPAGFAYQENQLHVYAADPAGQLRHWVYDQWTGQVSTEDLTTATSFTIAGDPAAYAYGEEGHVFFRDGGNGHLDHVWWTPAGGIGHDDWTSTATGDPASPAGNPAGFDYQGTGQHVFATDANGRLQHWWWAASENTIYRDTWY